MKITKRVDRVPLESLENGAVFKHPDSDTLYVKGFVHGTPNVSVNSGRTLALRLHDGLEHDFRHFKNSIKDNRYHDACSRVWGVMSGLQPVRPYSGRPSRNYDMFGAGNAGKTSTRAKKAR